MLVAQPRASHTRSPLAATRQDGTALENRLASKRRNLSRAPKRTAPSARSATTIGTGQRSHTATNAPTGTLPTYTGRPIDVGPNGQQAPRRARHSRFFEAVAADRTTRLSISLPAGLEPFGCGTRLDRPRDAHVRHEAKASLTSPISISRRPLVSTQHHRRSSSQLFATSAASEIPSPRSDNSRCEVHA